MSKLHDAARAGDLTTLDAAIAEGEDLDAQDMHKRTPLHLAAWAGQVDAVKRLIEAGCKLDVNADDGTSALHFACMKGHREAARKTGKGLTPLHLAAKRNHLELVEFLLKRKANPLNTNHRSQTAAMMASDSEVKAILSAAELEARAKQPMPSAAAEEVEDSQEAPGAAPPARPEAPSNDAEKATAPGPSAASDGGVQNGEQGVVTEGAASAGSLFRKRKAATAAIRPPGASDKIGVRGRGRGRIVPPGAKPS